ncbi:MAG: cell division topological specificity factor MinE [Candidatus Obscuribacterales bacterium]|jgi:cell division topological specificity factor|uniref:Cell division topological specificity factor MinE n=1 Tax=Candidatus Obscuribacter phosphatis TaxID=1906157 RepID=A0A8J7PEU5_9BACT|nr:cell division topological specificity factor MinE [Candidatus Obscuribacter phosphatis]MBX9941318.1 cell division topological specificity factor MinE [Candidatus Obscuribacterales bacterium]
MQRIFEWFMQPKADGARTTAKDRMRNMLTHDRLELPAGRLESLEEELVAVVSRYFELDKDTTQFDLQQYERRASLIANFRLLRSKC